MISVSNLSVQFGGHFLFRDISFMITSKDKVGLIGRNGTGKTTLLRVIHGDVKADNGNVEFSGEVNIGYLPQEIKSHSTFTVFEEAKTAFAQVLKLQKEIKEIAEKITLADHNDHKYYNDLLNKLADKNALLHNLGATKIDEEISRILTGLGFEEEEFDRSISELSGGWKMRVELAKILLKQPDLLMLDEPTNHLDIESITWLEDFLFNYPGAVILISHDSAFLDNVTNRTFEILGGKLIDYKANYSVYMEMRKIRKEHQMLAKKNQERYRSRLQENINKFRAKKNKAKFAQTLIRKLDKMELIEVDEIEDQSKVKIKFPPKEKPGKIVFKAEKLNKYYGDNHVIKDANFQIERGDRIAFIGKNGMGKTTLSKMLAGKEDYDGKLETGFRVTLGYYEQYQAEILKGDQSVLQTIEDVAGPDMRTGVRSLLGAFLFSGEDVDKKVKVLSGGEKSRLALAKLLTQPFNVLILDEPTNHLDMSTKEILKNALLDFDGVLILVSHDRDFLDGLTSKVFEFRKTGIKEHLGDIYEFLDTRKVGSLRDYESSKEVEKKSKSKNSVSDHKIWYEKKKQVEKTLRKNQKKVASCEREIQVLEKKIREIENRLADPDEYKLLSTDITFFSDYEKLKVELEKTMRDWEGSLEKLEQSERNYEKINKSVH